MNKISDQKILITGGAGFIGSSIARQLISDNEVHVFDALTTGSNTAIPDDVRFIQGDIRSKNDIDRAIRNIDTIFHEAAFVSVDGSVRHPEKSHNINVQGTINVLEAARRQNTRVIFASSAAIYGSPQTTPIKESHSKEPESPYGLDKLSADHYLRLYNDLYDLDTVPLRYFNVYGPRQTGDYAGVISVFIDQALKGEEITVHGDGCQTRDFVFIDDVVQANLLAARTDEVGEAYNIGTGESISIRELAEVIQDITDTDSDIVHTESRDGDIEDSVADISKAQTYLDFEPTVTLEEGLERTIEWFQDKP